MDIRIRTARSDDYEALCEVFEEGDSLHRDALPQVFRTPKGPVRARQYIERILDDENAALFVAEHGDRVVGAVHIFLREAPDIPIMVPRRYAVIDNIVVRQSVRRHGVGRALLRQAHRWAREAGAKQVELNVWEFNREAITFYEKQGYTTASRRMWSALE